MSFANLQRDRGETMASVTSNANVQVTEDFFLIANRLAPWKAQGSTASSYMQYNNNYSMVRPAPNIDMKNSMVL